MFQPEAMTYWLDRLPHVRFTNLYGPTEATIASSWFDVPPRRPDQQPIRAAPIGRACPGEELLVLNDLLERTAPGEIGEIYIAGVGITRGYWRDEEKTRRVFLRRPGGPDADALIYRTGDLGYVDDDGLVHFVGRADTQVKVRGHRIELGEIEAALDRLSELSGFAVVAVTSRSFGGMEICCAAAVKEGHDDVDAKWVRARLSEMVPRYMLPSRFKFLGTMPVNANGKIDRATISKMFRPEGAEESVTVSE